MRSVVLDGCRRGGLGTVAPVTSRRYPQQAWAVIVSSDGQNGSPALLVIGEEGETAGRGGDGYLHAPPQQEVTRCRRAGRMVLSHLC